MHGCFPAIFYYFFFRRKGINEILKWLKLLEDIGSYSHSATR